jgi:hypothetical protein
MAKGLTSIMPFNSREAVMGFIEHDYFGSAMRNDVTGMLNCFIDTAKIIVRHGDNPERYFSPDPKARQTDLRIFYEHLCGTFEPWFGGFFHVVDLEQQRAACYFTVRLTPRDASQLDQVGIQMLNNCNFFDFSDGKIKKMIIYYSNSAAAPDASVPTGYPQ